jgi:hypothetical protein
VVADASVRPLSFTVRGHRSPRMRTASPSTVRWFLGLSVLYACVGFASWSYIPIRFHCQATDLFGSSLLVLIVTYNILIGAAGHPVAMTRAEHPFGFWFIEVTGGSLAAFFALTGLGVIPTPCHS